VAHAWNPSYSGGSRFKATLGKYQDPISKNLITKNWAGGVAQGEGPEFKPQYHKKKKKKKEKKSSALGLALHPSGPPVFLENPLR
jgi:hypothetical protein